MDSLSYVPFDQDHPDFPAELRIERDSSQRTLVNDPTPILQDARMKHNNMFKNGCRKAFSGIFRYEDKDFRLIENMNSELLTELFFDIRHSTTSSEYADITPAVLGVREPRKLFFVSCYYHDPEHVIIRTHPFLKGFNWNDQVQIDNLNFFREAAIIEACGTTTFSENGYPLDVDEMAAMIDEAAEERQKKRKRAASDTDTPTGALTLSATITADEVRRALQPFQLQPPGLDSSSLRFQISPVLAAQLPDHGYHGTNWQQLQQGYQVPPGYAQPVALQPTQYTQHLVLGQPVDPRTTHQPGLIQYGAPYPTQQPSWYQFQSQFPGQGYGINQHHVQYDPQGFNHFHNPASMAPQPFQPRVNQTQSPGFETHRQQGFNPSENSVMGAHQQQGQQSLDQFQNPDFVPQYHYQQGYTQHGALHQSQQAFNQFQQDASTGTGAGGVAGPSQSAFTVALNQLRNGDNSQTDNAGEASQSITNTMTEQDSADDFIDNDMDDEEFWNL